jgi:hypothetical protein
MGETQWTYKRRIQIKMESLISESLKPPVMRMVSLWPTIKWPLVWKNVQMMPGTDTVRVQLYKTIHDLLPTNARLHRINLLPTGQCRDCTQEDTLQHRFTECGELPCIRQWTRQRIAAILRIDKRYIPAECLLRPDFYLWPPKRHRAVLWIIAHMVIYRTKQDRSLTMNDYLHFMRRAKWKFDNQPSRNRLVGTYLSILEL